MAEAAAADDADAGICGRLLTFLSKSLSFSRPPQKQIANGGGGGGGAGGDGDHFAIEIEQVGDTVDWKEEEEAAAAGKKKGPMPRVPVLRVPSNINERSQSFIDKRKRNFAGEEVHGREASSTQDRSKHAM